MSDKSKHLQVTPLSGHYAEMRNLRVSAARYLAEANRHMGNSSLEELQSLDAAMDELKVLLALAEARYGVLAKVV